MSERQAADIAELAATRGSKLVKREYMKVNVIHTCQQIIVYILHQAPAPYPGVPIPRLSLYLSAQLSYGVVCVYHRQCDLLIEEMKNTLERLYRAEKQMKIDFLQPEQQLLLPDALSLMEMLEAAPDPFFGMMGIPPELPDPLMIPQIRMLVEAPSPERVRMEKTPPTWKRRWGKEDAEHVTSPESITLREVEPVTLPSVEFVRDLPEVSAHDLEFLMSDLPPFPEEETIPEPKRKERVTDVEGQERKILTDRTLPKETKKRPSKVPEKDELSITAPTTVSLKLDKGAEELESLQEAERVRERLREMESEKERLQKAERERQLQQEAESKRKSKKMAEREGKHQKESEKERERLKKTFKKIKDLREIGADEEQLEEMRRKAEHLKKLQKERESQWNSEMEREHLKDSQKERERLQEAERERERLRVIDKEIERLKRSLEKREQESRKKRKTVKEEDSADETRRTKVESPIARLSPTTGLQPETGLEYDADVLLLDITGEPVIAGTPEKRSSVLGSPLPPMPPLRSPQLVLPELSPERRRRTWVTLRKRGLIIDKETQIGSKKMQQQMSVPDVHTQPLVPVKVPSMKSRTLADLLQVPTYQHWMAPELSALWSHCAVLEHVPYVQELEEETMIEMEAVRGATEPSVSLMLSSELSLEASEEERSHHVLLTPEERRTLSMSDDRFLPAVPEIPEHMVELPETDDISLPDVQRRLRTNINSAGHTEFTKLAPCSFSRMMASRLFYSCLVLCTQRMIRLEQTEPYGEILITPGQHYMQT